MLKLRDLRNTGVRTGREFYYIPYHAVGKTNGLLPGCSIELSADRSGWRGENSKKNRCWGICAEQVSSQKRYQMILHPQLLEG